MSRSLIRRAIVICVSIFAAGAPAAFSQSISFGRPEIVVQTETDFVTSVFAADVDGDGDSDILSASQFDDKIAWYENTDGTGVFGPQRVITTSADGATSVIAADVDGDGDIDVLSASQFDDKIAWYENIDGAGAFGPQRVITTSADGAQSVFAIDLDGDGDVDVLSASPDDDKIAWYENTDGAGMFGAQQAITTSADGAASVFAADLDGDGDADVLTASSFDHKFAWYENLGEARTFGPRQIIGPGSGADSILAVDVDGDGDLDVIAGSRSGIRWFENTDGLGLFGPPEELNPHTSRGLRSVISADLDRDGDPDVLVAGNTSDTIGWFVNTGVVGPADQFRIAREIYGAADGPSSVFAADFDGDGDVDIVSASHNDDRITWFENFGDDHDLHFQRRHLITPKADGAQSVFAVDIDGDADLDILFASFDDNRVGWYENTDGLGDFAHQRVIKAANPNLPRKNVRDLHGNPFEPIEGNGNGAVSVFGADLDGDGDVDVLSASPQGRGFIEWYENTDGLGNFGPQRVISEGVFRVASVFAADLDGDGDMDALSAITSGNKITWYENTDGLGTFGPERIIDADAFQAHSVFAADVDGDGDQDVLSSFFHQVAWYENTDGSGAFGPRRQITAFTAVGQSVFAIDIDGDGDIDVLSASNIDDKIAWYENLDGLGSFGFQIVITSVADGAESVFAVDLDQDGDVDVLSASGNDDKIAWYENLDGEGHFGPQQVITTSADGAQSVFAADMDGDGGVDVLSASAFDNKIAWYKNLLTPPLSLPSPWERYE